MKRPLENPGAGNPAKRMNLDIRPGMYLKVYWDNEGKWYRGSVVQYDAQTNVAQIFYEHDNVEETIDLNQKKWDFDNGTSGDPQPVAAPIHNGFSEADLLLTTNAVFPIHVQCLRCQEAEMLCTGCRPCTNWPDETTGWDRNPDGEELSASAMLRYEKLGEDSGVKVLTPEQYEEWKKKSAGEEDDSKKKAQPQRPQTDVLKVFELELKQPVKTKALPSFYSYRCPDCMEEFNRIRDLEMHVGWSHTSAMVPADWKGFKCQEADILPGRGLPFACPFVGCNRGANSQQEIQEHICRHHDISDPTKPKNVKTAQPKTLRRRIEPRADPNKPEPLNLEFFKQYTPPGHPCQADAMIKHFVKKILCSGKKLDVQAEALPPRPEQPLNLPHMELSPPDASWFVQDMQPATDYYEVEAVVNDRVNESNNEPEYLVKWKGYDEPTWEPARVIAHLPMYQEYLQNKANSTFPETVKEEAIEDALDPSAYSSNVFH